MNLSQSDKKYIWHPLTQAQNKHENIAIIKAQGVYLYDENGHRYIDAIASWYTSMFGHCHQKIVKSVQKQMQNLDQIVFAGFTHKPAVQLAQALIEILPSSQQKIFFSDNGSTANEVAIKMSLQYFYNLGQKKQTLIAFENAFHGDTFAAMSVSGLDVYNKPFLDLCLKVERIPVPNDDNIEQVLQMMEKLLQKQDVAAFIYEPLVQGANAMHMYKANYLDRLIAMCKKNEVICIADEVMTGFGKTGKIFASNYLQNQADIMCFAKALTAGFAPMALTSCSQKIYSAFLSNSMQTAFLHAHTYTANPLTCTAALAALELLQTKEIIDNRKNINQSLHNFRNKIKHHPYVASTRLQGVILAIDLQQEISRYGNKRNEIFDFFMQRGIYLRPLGNTIYIVPAFIMTQQELQKIYHAILEFLNCQRP